jgi:hypothetical protein
MSIKPSFSGLTESMFGAYGFNTYNAIFLGSGLLRLLFSLYWKLKGEVGSYIGCGQALALVLVMDR